VFVRAHVYMATSVPVHVNYWVRDNGQLVPHAMQVRLTQDENALTWTLVEPTGAFLAALKNGALAQDKGCTASAPVSDKPPPM
jgi:hypothetical protein